MYDISSDYEDNGRVYDKRLLLIFGSLIILIYLWIPVIKPYLPSNEPEAYFELALLGENGKAENYFPDNNSTIVLYEQIKWQVHVLNKMGKSESISLRIKLLNSSSSGPEQKTCTPSQASIIYDIKDYLSNNETGNYPLFWSITSITQNIDDDEKTIDIILNNKELHVNANDSDNSFRLVIELWVYNQNTEKMDFGWENLDGKRCAWTQMWFKIEEN